LGTSRRDRPGGAAPAGAAPAGAAPAVVDYFHQATHSVTYVVADEAARKAAIIDPVLDFSPRRLLGAPIAIGERVTKVQRHFAKFHDFEPGFRADGGQSAAGGK
jgi:hypothetical protein